LFLLEGDHVLMHSLVGGKVESNGDRKLEMRSLLDSHKVTSSQDLAVSLKTFLRESLPDYMIPSSFVLMDALPLTVEGKVDRRALPQPDEAQGVQPRVHEAPHSDLEHLLATIAQDVLQLEQVGIQENFFELGGDSVQLVQ